MYVTSLELCGLLVTTMALQLVKMMNGDSNKIKEISVVAATMPLPLSLPPPSLGVKSENINGSKKRGAFKKT